MRGFLVRTAVRGSMRHVRHVRPVSPRRPRGQVAEVYRQVERDFGLLAPPVCLHSPSVGPLAACWTMLRETLVVSGRAERAMKEAVAAAVSQANTCPYCVEVHGAALHGVAGRPESAARARAGQADPFGDSRIRDITEWARAIGTRDGAGRHTCPFPAEQAPEIVGVAVTFHYLNRMVNIFLDPSPLPAGVPDAVRDRAGRGLGHVLGQVADRPHEPGASLPLLPAAELPADLRWACGNHTIAAAFGRAVAAAEAAADRSVPAPVRDLVTTRLAAWDGRPTGLSRAWVTEATAALPAPHRPAGRLALLTAVASHQVDQSVVAGFRRHQPDDSDLIDLTSWASLAAARRVGGWIPATGAAVQD